MKFSSRALVFVAAAGTSMPYFDGSYASAFVISPDKLVQHASNRRQTAGRVKAASPEDDIGLPDVEQSSWLDTFSVLDTDESGFIDCYELKAGLVALGQPSSDDDIARLMEAEGLSSDVCIDKETFLRITGAYDETVLTRSDLIDMFATIDIDSSGYLTAAELQHFIGNLPISNSFSGDNKISHLLQMYDDDGNGRITFDEFEQIFTDLGFKVNDDNEKSILNVKPAGEIITSSVAADAEKVPYTDEASASMENPESKLITLSYIENEDLREALASFDSEGKGIIDLNKVRQAAEGKTPPKLHWSENRPRVGLADHVHSMNHIAILVSDVSRSLQFYKEIIGFEQIRRPNFDAHGAWLTMGNAELHLIKGKPLVHEGDDLVVGHISVDADNIHGVLPKLKAMNVPFRVNSSVPAGADVSMNTNANDDMMSDSIVTQFFLRDPDGYYVEVCNCDDTLTKYCLGEKDDLSGYDEGVPPLSLAAASTTINLMQRWMAKLETDTAGMEDIVGMLYNTDGSIEQVAKLLGCEPVSAVDGTILQTLKDRHSIYGDVWQNEEESDIEEILREAGNDPKSAEKIVKLRKIHRGKTIYRPPVVFNADGTKYSPKKIEKLHSTSLPRV